MDEHVHRHHEEDMLSVEDAKEKILGTVCKTEVVTIPVTDSLGLVLSDNVTSSINIPLKSGGTDFGSSVNVSICTIPVFGYIL